MYNWQIQVIFYKLIFIFLNIFYRFVFLKYYVSCKKIIILFVLFNKNMNPTISGSPLTKWSKASKWRKSIKNKPWFVMQNYVG